MQVPFQDILIATIKGVGQDLIDHAEEYAGSGDLCTSFKIEIDLDPDDDKITVPTITVHRSYISDTAWNKKHDLYFNVKSEN